MSENLTAEEYFERAMQKAKRWEDQGVNDDLTQALRLKPDWADAYWYRSNARQNLGDHDGALADMEEVVRLQPENTRAKDLCEMLRSIPRTSEARRALLLGMWELVANDHRMARMYGFNLVQQSKTYPELDIQRPMDEIMKRNPVVGYLVRGAYFQALNDRSKAVEAYTEAIRLDPQLAQAYFDRAIVYGGSDSAAEALADYTRVIELYIQQNEHPINVAAAYFSRGRLRGYTGDLEGASADLAEVLRLRPEYIDGLFKRAELWEEKGDFDKAIADYTSVIQSFDQPDLNSHRTLSYLNRGRLREDKGDLAGTLKDWEAYLALGGGERFGDRVEVEQWIREVEAKLNHIQ